MPRRRYVRRGALIIFLYSFVKGTTLFEVKLSSPSMLNTFFIRGLDIVTRSLCFPLLSRLFLADLIRTIPETIRLVFDFCLSPACSAASPARTKILIQIVTNAIPLYQQHTGLCGPLRAMPYRLLQFRLGEGREVTPDDPNLLEIQSTIPSTRADIISALEILRTPAWERSRVCLNELLVV